MTSAKWSGALNLIALTVDFVGLLFMLRNVRAGHGDRIGASRLALFIFGVSTARWIFTANWASRYVVFGHRWQQNHPWRYVE